MLYYKKVASPLGEITLRSDGEALTGLWFADDKHYGAKDIAGAVLADLDVFTQAEAWLAEYFAGREPKVSVPLKLQGSEFQMQVWRLLQDIPYGSTAALYLWAISGGAIEGMQDYAPAKKIVRKTKRSE